MHIHPHALTHTSTHTHTCTNLCTLLHIIGKQTTQTCMHMHKPVQIHAHASTYLFARMHTYNNNSKHSCIQMQPSMSIHLRTHMNTKTDTCTYHCLRHAQSWRAFVRSTMGLDRHSPPFYYPPTKSEEYSFGASVHSVRPEPYLSTYWSDLMHSWFKC